MKIYIQLLTIFTITGFLVQCESYKQEPAVDGECNRLRSFEGITTLNGEKYSGSCVIRVEGKKTDIKSFKNGIPHGMYKKFYYPSENIEFIGYRKNGEIHGDYIMYHENGNIAIKGALKRGYYTGEWYYYDDQGILRDQKRFRRGKEIK